MSDVPDAVRDPFTRSIERIPLLTVILTVLGSAALLVIRGPLWGLGFLIGGAIAYGNFISIRILVDRIMTREHRPLRTPARLSITWIALRFLLLAIGGFAILRYSRISLTALLLGLFVSLIAVIAQVLFELIYDRT